MDYIVHKRFKERAICGDVNIPAQTPCNEINGIIYHNGNALCLSGSENAHTYFSANYDGCGMYRGNVINSIVSLLRKKDDQYQARWDMVWEDPVCKKYKRKEHPDHWLWNNDFYTAEIADLEYILKLVQKG